MNCQFTSLCLFFNWVFYLFSSNVIFKYIRGVNTLPDINCRFFSQLVTCLLILFMVLFSMKIFCNSIKSFLLLHQDFKSYLENPLLHIGYRWIHQCFLLVSVLCLHLWSIWCLFFCMVWGINLTILKFIPAPAILNNFYPMINFCMYLGILNFIFYFTDLNFYAPVPHYFIIDYLSYWKPFFYRELL